MRRLLILADDLTGAADCANAFTGYGLSAAVTFEDTSDDIADEILAIDCNTRHLAPDEAAACVARIMRKHTLSDPNLPVFKKVDSTLRGNVGAELRAVLEERRHHMGHGQRIVAVVAPAFPAGGRTTIGGHQMVHGVPLDQTEIWAHNRLAGAGYLPAMFQNVGLRTTLLTLESIRSGRAQLSAAMQRASLESDVLVCDSENDEDLKAIAEASLSLGEGTIRVGSAGLAYQFPRAAHWPASARRIGRPEFSMAPTLFVVGSMSTVSHRQAVRLEEGTPVTAIRIQPSILLSGPSVSEWANITARIDASLKSGHDTMIVLDASECTGMQQQRRLAGALGMMLVPYARIVGALVVTGGETARAILDGWGVTALTMLDELEPGLPYSFARLNSRPLPVLTKAGAFGNDETLISCRKFLTSLLREQNPAGHDQARKSS